MFCANLGAVLSLITGSAGWQAVLSGTSTGKELVSGGLAIDSSGNTVTVAPDYTTAGSSTGAFITKVSSAGAKVWQRKIASTSFSPATTVFPSFTAVDSADNVIATAFDSSNLYIYVFKYDSAGTLLWQRRIPIATGGTGFDWHGIAIDSSDNISIVCVASSVMTLLTISPAGTLTQQKAYGVLALSRSIKYTTSGNRIIAGKGATYPALLAVDSAGAVLWGQTFSVGRSGRIEEVALDSTGNVYAVGGTLNAASTLTQPMILKYSSAGALQWQKIFTSTDSITLTSCAIDSADLLYVVGYSSVAPTYSVVMCIDSAGAIVWQTKIQINILGSPFYGSVQSSSVSTQTPGTLTISSGVSWNVSAPHSQAIVSRIPTNAATVGTWGWLIYSTLSLTVSNLGYTAVSLSQAVTTPALALTTSTLVNSVSAALVDTQLISEYTYYQENMRGSPTDLTIYHRDVTVATDKAMYYVSSQSASSTAIYVTKTNASGQIVWQRSYTITASPIRGPRIVLNAAQDTLYIYLPRLGNDAIEVITYSTLGVLGLRKIIPSLGLYSQYSNNHFCIDATDNVYVCSQQNIANVNSLITKLDSSLTLVYSKRLTVSGFTPSYNCISPGSDGVYVATNELATGLGVLFKMSTDGVTVLWQRYIGPAAIAVYPTGVRATASGFVYAGFSYGSGTEIGIVKCNASTGAAVWQRRISGLANVVAGPAIIVDAADNVYVLTQIYNAVPVYVAVLAKFDSAGNQVWQRKFTQTAGQDLFLYSIQTIGTTALAIAGYGSNTFGPQAFSYLLNADGSGLNATLGAMAFGEFSLPAIPYAASTYPVSTTTANSAAITAVTTSAYSITLTNGTGVSSTTAGTVAALLNNP